MLWPGATTRKKLTKDLYIYLSLSAFKFNVNLFAPEGSLVAKETFHGRFNTGARHSLNIASYKDATEIVVSALHAVIQCFSQLIIAI